MRFGIRQKQKNSGLVPSLPFGYYLDRNTGKVEIDTETAEYVRKIFKLYVEGYGLCTITKKLNERGIRSPEYYQKRKLADWKPLISRQYLWEQTSIKRILSNEMYIGTLVNHKTVTSKIYKTKTFIAPEEQYSHENFCEPIIDKHTWKQAQFLLKQRSEINPRSSGGRKLHRYSGLIKCAECGSCFIAKNRSWRGREYIEYTCNSNHRYGKQYCTPHRIRESQLDELVFGEVQNLKGKIVAESEKCDEIVEQWIKQKPAYDLRIRQYEEKIIALKQQIEDLIMGKVTDKYRAEFYNNMIEKRESKIAEIQQKISECRAYDRVCKQRQQILTSTSSLLDDILSDGRITDANLRMLVNGVTVHQNEDKSLDVHFEMNGNFSNSTAIILEPMFEYN